MRILGIETTCDETAAAVVGIGFDGRGEILSNEVLSQIAEHARYGGVVPEIAARAHVEVIDRLWSARAEEARTAPSRMSTASRWRPGPGLIGGVLVGLTTAKAIALVTRKPLMAVNHLEAHALTARLTDGIGFPYLLLLASGGHTQLVAVRGVGDYVRLGTTIDDAIGEAFDKVAKLLGLPYPGGPHVETRGREGQSRTLRPARGRCMGRPEPNFSLSGLKTAAADRGREDRAAHRKRHRRSLRELPGRRRRRGGRPHPRGAARFPRDRRAIRPRSWSRAASRRTRPCASGLQRLAVRGRPELVAPPVALCGDNGAMIAWAGLERLRLGLVDDIGAPARARWPLDTSRDEAGAKA